MKILALIRRPRKKGNTDILVDQILRGCKGEGHPTKKHFIYTIMKYPPCMDCRNCKKVDYVCTLDGGMQKIYPRMEKVDLVIFGTPNYWYSPTGKMKLL